MPLLTALLIGFVAVFHLYILWREMFARKTRGPQVFRHFPKELFPKTKSLAANQGLYNGFPAAGLIWLFFIPNPERQRNVACLLYTSPSPRD